MLPVIFMCCYMWSFAVRETQPSNEELPGWCKASAAGGPGEEAVALRQGWSVQPMQELQVLSPLALQPKPSHSPVLLGWEPAVFMR